MKKKYLYVIGAKKWNNLLGKFSKLQKRLHLLANNDSTQYSKLVSKLKSIYVKLEKMQYQTGIKVAGTSLAVVLSAFTANAQFGSYEYLKYNGGIHTPGRSSSTFEDIDSDGDMDLILGNSVGKVEQFINDGGTYTSTGSIILSTGTSFIVGTNASPVFADIDGDGYKDLYIGNGAGEIRHIINTNGTYSYGANLQAGGTDVDVGNNSAPVFADIDGDGDLDLYVGDGQGEINVFTNNAGVFTAAGVLSITGSSTIPTYTSSNAAPTFADVDGDGDLDLYTGNIGGGIDEFTNDGGVFTHAGVVNADGSYIDVGEYASPTFEDVDNDGDLDLIVNGENSKIKIYTNTAGVFSANGHIMADDITIGIGINAAPTFADIDGDGDQDLYVGGWAAGDDEIRVFTNNGGIFTDANTLPLTGIGYLPKPVFEDLDGDGDLDLYVGDYYGTIKSWTNNGGNFTAAADLQVDGNPVDLPYYLSPAFADIDGDGDLDFYAGHYGVVEVFTNNSGVFTGSGVVQTGGVDIDVNYHAAPAFADIDGDGDLDLYVGNAAGEIKLFTNTNGVFSAGVNLQADGSTIYVGFRSTPTFADIDGDGDLDLYVGNQKGNILFYENTSASAILVSSIAIQGVGSANTISTNGGTLQMEATVLPANASNSNYTWSLVNGTGAATIDANGLVTASANGTVTVTATANDASGETASMVVTISNQTSTGINEETVNRVSIYPNPVQNQLFVEKENETINQLEIIDFSGRIVKSIAENNVKSINVSELNQGIYILKIETANGTSIARFVKK